MQNQIIHLIRYAKAKGCVISVYDGEAWAVKRSTNEREIIEAIQSVDDAQIVIRDPNGIEPGGGKVGWALIVNGLENDELVADHTANEWMDAWAEDYNQKNAA